MRVYDLEGTRIRTNYWWRCGRAKGASSRSSARSQLYREFQQAENKAELAARWGIDRSDLYEVVRDIEIRSGGLFGAQGGPSAQGMPATLAEAHERIWSWNGSTSGRRPGAKSSTA